MATSQPVATYTVYVTLRDIRHELSVTVRDIGNCDGEALAGMTAHTIATWARVWLAVMRNDTGIPEYKGKPWLSACQQKEVANLPEFEPHVTVWNKAWNNGGIGITVHSWDNGLNALRAANAMFSGLEKINEHFAKFDIEKFEFLTTSPQAKPAPKPATSDKDDVDKWLKDESDKAGKPNNPVESTLPFRRFKQLAENIIQVQEFKQGGGGDKYQKSAIKATLPFHKTNVQYEDDSLVYYPITDAITIVEGQFGTQAVIPTANGRVYVSKDNKNGEETPDWHNFAQDLHDNYEPLLNDDIHNLFAPACVLVMKTGKQSDNKQYKNYYHIYQPLKD